MNKVAVLGSINADISLRVPYFPQSGQSIYATGISIGCGGKGANASAALAKLGAEVRLCGCVGNDANADVLLQHLISAGVDVSSVQKKGEHTGTAYLFVEPSGENRIVVAPGANELLTSSDIDRWGAPLICWADVVLIQLEISPLAIRRIIDLCHAHQKMLVIDAGPVRGMRAEDLRGVYCVSPNETELEALTGMPVKSFSQVKLAAKALRQNAACQQVLVKRGEKGCYFIDDKIEFLQPAYNVQVVDTTAAGDSFTAGYCLAAANGMGPVQAIEYASKCGALATMHTGAFESVPSAEQVNEFCAALRSQGLSTL